MTSSMDFSQFDFSDSMHQIQRGLLLVPTLQTYLFDAKFPAFDIHFKKEQMERAPDDWFHPSTHPLWSNRALFNYLAHPDEFPVEKKRYMSTLSVMFGKVMHEFIQMCLVDAGMMHRENFVCDWPEHQGKACGEPGFYDPDLGERGHLDGLLDLSALKQHVAQDKISPVFEFKTTTDNFSKLTKIEDLDEEAFKKKWPDYWAQQQRYMRGKRRSLSIVLMMEIGYPWVMREFHIPYDYAFNSQIDAKYAAVRMAVESGEEPYCCGLKGCPAYELCKTQMLRSRA